MRTVVPKDPPGTARRGGSRPHRAVESAYRQAPHPLAAASAARGRAVARGGLEHCDAAAVATGISMADDGALCSWVGGRAPYGTVAGVGEERGGHRVALRVVIGGDQNGRGAVPRVPGKNPDRGQGAVIDDPVRPTAAPSVQTPLAITGG